MKKSRKSVIAFIILVIALWSIIIMAVVDDGDKGKGNTVSTPLPGNAGVYRDIAAERDCGELQATFDRAMDNYGRGSNKDIVMSYAKAAINRMEAICYKR